MSETADIKSDRKAMSRMSELEEQKREKQHKNVVLEIFIINLGKKENELGSFDKLIWMAAAIERVVISPTGKMTFDIKDGTEICR